MTRIVTHPAKVYNSIISVSTEFCKHPNCKMPYSPYPQIKFSFYQPLSIKSYRYL